MQLHLTEVRYRLPIRRMAWWGSLWLLGLASVMTLVALQAPDTGTYYGSAITVAMMLLSLLCLALGRFKQWGSMVRSFIWGHWLLAVALLWCAGGLYSPLVIAFPAWLALWCGYRACVRLCSCSVLRWQRSVFSGGWPMTWPNQHSCEPRPL